MSNVRAITAAIGLPSILAGCVYLGCPDCYKILGYGGPDPTYRPDPGLRPLWLPTILIVQDDPRISCRQKPGGADTLQVVAHVKNYGQAPGGPFWSKFAVSYTEHPSGNSSTKTYYVNSGWAFSGPSTSGASPELNSTAVIGALSGGEETDIIVTLRQQLWEPCA